MPRHSNKKSVPCCAVPYRGTKISTVPCRAGAVKKFEGIFISEQEETGNVVFEYSAVYDAGSENKKLGSDSDYGLRLPALELHSKAVHPVLP